MRNPAWLSEGVERNARMFWSEPEILLYEDDGQKDELSRFNSRKKLQHIVFVVDGAANLVSTIVNGKLCDGGRYCDLGWTRFDKQIENINGSRKLSFDSSFNGIIKLL